MEQKLSLTAYVDIETLPTEDAAIIAALDAEIAPPGQYKKPESKAEWMEREKPGALAKEIADTAKDGTYGRVLAVGCALEAGPVQVWIGDERQVLEGFFGSVRAAELVDSPGGGEYHAEITWVGHNVRAFDLRFLWQRAVINKLPMPRSLVEAVHARTWNARIADTMWMWNPERDKHISMANLCRALGVPSPKGDLDGSKIAAAWAAREVERIIAYSKAEIEALRECYRRMIFAP